MTDVVILAEAGTSRRCVFHRPHDPYGDGYVFSLRVELEDVGLSAEGSSTLDGREGYDLPAFFEHLTERWRGWAGTLSWMSLDGEMTLNAAHFGSRVLLSVTLRRPSRPYEPDAWSACVAFNLEPGEQLRNLALMATSVLNRG